MTGTSGWQGKRSFMLILNGFEIKTRLEGTPQQYYTAKRGEEVFTSKDLNYIKRKVNSRAPEGAKKWDINNVAGKIQSKM